MESVLRFLVAAPHSCERNVLLADCSVVDDRQVCGTCARGAGRERDRDDAIVGRRKRTRTSAARQVVAVVRSGGADTRNVQRCGAGVSESHALGETVAYLYRSEVQAAR